MAVKLTVTLDNGDRHVHEDCEWVTAADNTLVRVNNTKPYPHRVYYPLTAIRHMESRP